MPQHVKRIKVRRKDLKKPDEFETLTGQAVAWAQVHRSLVLTVAAGALVLALGFLALGRWRDERNAAAGAAFRDAHASFEAGRFTDAARAFADVESGYPRTPFGRLAGLYRGHALARQGDPAGAATAYGEYIATSPPSDYLRQEALTGLARAKEATGDTGGALLGAARLHEAAGEVEKAREIYTALLKDASDPELHALLTAKLPAVGGADAKAAEQATTAIQ
jgi:TolA-binding protein